MKKLFIFILTFIFFFSSFVSFAAAEERKDIEADVGYSDFFASLPEGLRQNMPDGASGEDSLSDAEAVFEWNFILSALAEIFGREIKNVLPLFCTLCATVLAAAAMGAIRGAVSEKFAPILSFCSGAAVCAASLALQYSVLSSVSRYLSDLCVLINALLPLTVSLYAAGGNVAAASVSAGGFGIFLNLCENFLCKTIMPFCGVCLAFALCTAVSPSVNLRPLAGTVKKTYTTLLSFISMLFCFILAAQNAIAVGHDTLSLRAAKFVAGSAVPVLGGVMSESMKAFFASVGILRKSIGAIGIALILMLFLPILISLFLTKLANSTAAGFAALLGCERESVLLSEIASVYGYVCAVLCVSAVSFVFVLTLLITTAAAGA